MPSQFETLTKCPNPLCTSKKITFLFKAPDRLTDLPGEFSLCRCKDCDLVFQNPRVKEKDIGLYYTGKLGYYNPPPAKEIGNKNKINRFKNFFKKQTLANHFGYKFKSKNLLWFLLTLPLKRCLLAVGFPFFQKDGKFLDIGCAHGWFLEEMKNLGWQVKGIEMDEQSAAFARNERKLEVYTKRIEECHFEKEEFDAITMRMVLEHLYSPFEALRQFTLWLKPNGQLIFSIPYFKGFESQWFKNSCYNLQLPTHITFFTKKIIRDYLRKLGYRNVKFYHHFFERDIVASAHYKYQDTKNLFYKIIAYDKLARTLLVKPFVFLLGIFGKSSRVTVYALKIKD